MRNAPGMDRRRGQRHSPEGLHCPLGDVIDLSPLGMRIAGTGKCIVKVGQTGNVRIDSSDGSVTVAAKVIWLRRRGLRKHEIGFEFIDVAPVVRDALRSIAEFGFLPKPGHTGRGRTRTTASLTVPDYYRVLGVAYDATTEQIHKAYRKLARVHHPDVASDPESAERFKVIAEAYHTLKDAEQRALFDLRTALAS